jgi:hypothetical protein
MAFPVFDTCTGTVAFLRAPEKEGRASLWKQPTRWYLVLDEVEPFEREFPRWTGPIPGSGSGYRPRGLEGKIFRLLGGGERASTSATGVRVVSGRLPA